MNNKIKLIREIVVPGVVLVVEVVVVVLAVVGLALSVRHVSLSSKPQPVLQHLLLFNSSAVQIRLPTAEHSAWANANVLVIHDFGVMHV